MPFAAAASQGRVLDELGARCQSARPWRLPANFAATAGSAASAPTGSPCSTIRRITQNRRQVDEAVRSNILEFLDRLAAFTTTRPHRTAQDLAAETAIER
jgi:hypothetical protein